METEYTWATVTRHLAASPLHLSQVNNRLYILLKFNRLLAIYTLVGIDKTFPNREFAPNQVHPS
jgi:hypothetical protein